MAGRIPRVFINDLLARTDIVDLIDARVKLKKQGKNFHACCPFHNEKTPSFTVNGEKQFYHCFGCGAHGNAIDFLMNYDKLEFVETVEELAAMHNLEVPFEAGSGPSQIERHQRQTLYQLMDGLNTFYQQSLQQPVANIFFRLQVRAAPLTPLWYNSSNRSIFSPIQSSPSMYNMIPIFSSLIACSKSSLFLII